jgi:hypothetical protein
MFLRRSDADSLPLITNQVTGDEMLNADNLEFDHRPVPRIHLMYEACCCWGFEIGYFGIDSWSTSGQGGYPNSPVLTGPGLDFASTAPGTVYRVNYGTNLYNTEFNIRRRWNECTTFLAGFRWIELQDDLQTVAVAPTLTDMYSIDTDNHLYGFQIGADMELYNCTCRFHIDAIGRVGVMYNNVDQSIEAPILTPLSAVAVDNLTHRNDHTAFVSELGLRGVYDLTPSFSVFGGYRVMWLDGIALAPDQIPVNDLTGSGTSGLDTGGTLYFHGATVGLQVTF